jgi:hypothetical protein
MPSIIAKRFALTLLIGAAASSAGAKPCTGIDQTLSDARKAEFATPIAAQLGADHVTVNKYMGLKDWSIVYVDAPNGDPPFVFFKGDPSKTHYVTLWSGAAMIDEERSIRQWTLKNAPGIPKQLAACFAWFVTPPNRDQ